MTQWKCNKCGYRFEADPPPPSKCPSCKQDCTFVDITCYIPECQTDGVDRRL